MRVISTEELERTLTFPVLVDRLREAFRAANISAPVRQQHGIPNREAPDGTLLIMPAWQEGGHIGVKTVTVYPGNPAHARPAVMGTYILLDARSGAPIAVMDGRLLTLRRTAAASALAASYLARRQAQRLLVVGTGALAPYLASAHSTVRPIREVVFWGRSPEKARRVAEQWRRQDLAVSFTEDLPSAVGRADIVSCATMATQPLIEGAWLTPGTHIDLVGGFTRDMREADDAAILRAVLFVDTRHGALSEAGDIIRPIETGVIREDDIAGDLFTLARGAHSGRRSDEEVTLFKSVGTALEDLVAARVATEAI